MPAFVRISLLCLLAGLPALADGAQLREPLARSHASPGRAETVQQERNFERVRVSLLTILPGSDIYSLWGHSAIRVVDSTRGTDLSFNYGTFDFDTNFFVLKFMQGNLDYLLSIHDFENALSHYRIEGRPVLEQALYLTPEQRRRLIQFLEINYLPENRSYRYHFLFDNCSTRVRDAIKASLEDAVRFSDEPDPGKTFRELIDPYQRAVPFLDAGIDWLLGAPVDRVAGPRETMFLPDYLMSGFEQARVEVDGAMVALAADADTLLWIEGYEAPASRFPWEAGFTWLLVAVGLAATLRRQNVSRGLDGPLFLVTGLAGLLITYLWFISHHDVTDANWHVLWAWPTHFAAGLAILWRGRSVRPWIRFYMVAAGVVSLAAIVGIPWTAQAFNPVLVPIALLVSLRGAAVFAASRKAPSGTAGR